MEMELRADGLHISGYVNVTEKISRPIITGKGQKVVELIEPRAFERALEKADNVQMTRDHNPDYVLAETRAKTLELHEDAIGLHYKTVITDGQTIADAQAGKLKGLSFGMKNIVDKIEQRADDLPLRKVSAFDLDHITLVVNKMPAYAATSIEMRADDEVCETEIRSTEESPKITEEKTAFSNHQYKNRIAALRIAGIGGKNEKS
jgi:HK97 family phage prohead protease